MLYKVIFGLYFLCQFELFHAKFYSGTISWIEERSNKVRLTYRMSWQKGTGPCGPSCSPRDDGRNTSITDPKLARLSFMNNGTSLGDVHYVITDVSETNTSGWEQGENSYVFTPSTNKTVIKIDKIPWIKSGQGNKKDLGLLQTTIDVRIRNDTNRSNISPFASVPPYIGVQYGCTTTVKIPAVDPDGDRVVCRWAEPSECGGACSNVPVSSVFLDQSGCSLTVDAGTGTSLQAGLFYRLALVIEDFPDDVVKVGTEVYDRQTPFSQIPYQVSLRVSTVNIQCGLHNMTFVIATPQNFASLQLTLRELYTHKSFNTSFYIQTDNPSVLNFIVSGPRGLESQLVPDDLSAALNRSDVVKLSVGWKPDYKTQAGGSQICVWGVDVPYGLTTEVHCITLYASDYNQCSITNCRNNGTCKNIYGSTEKCICKPGFKGRQCETALKCHDNPCLNNGTCSEDPVNGYTCNCSIGYMGKDCERANMTIILNNISFNATQSNGYTTQSNTINGTQSNVNGTQSNVNGTQSNVNGTQSNVNGTQSNELVSDTGGTNTALLWEILGAILGFILLVIIALLIYKAAKRKVRPQKVTDGEQ